MHIFNQNLYSTYILVSADVTKTQFLYPVLYQGNSITGNWDTQSLTIKVIEYQSILLILLNFTCSADYT